MQFDLQRAFPYPVLRPQSQDYVDGDFQTSVDFEVDDGGPIVARIHCQLSVDDIGRLIERKQACIAVIVSCRETFVRHVEKRYEPSFEVHFPSGHLRGEVEVFPFIVATQHLVTYSSPLLHPDWCKAPVSFEAGAVLAVDEPQVVYIDRDLFRPITSVFSLVKNDNIQNNEWHVSVDDDTVRISVSAANKEILDRVRNTDANRAILINSIYSGAVVHCVRQLRGGDAHDEYRWAKVLRAQAQIAEIDLVSEDEYVVAQRLLRLPLGLLNSYVFPEER